MAPLSKDIEALIKSGLDRLDYRRDMITQKVFMQMKDPKHPLHDLIPPIKVWCSSISTSTKVQLYRVYIQPILLYGSETWALTRALEDRIAAFDNFCLRRILRIPYTAHVTNAGQNLLQST